MNSAGARVEEICAAREAELEQLHRAQSETLELELSWLPKPRIKYTKQFLELEKTKAGCVNHMDAVAAFCRVYPKNVPITVVRYPDERRVLFCRLAMLYDPRIPCSFESLFYVSRYFDARLTLFTATGCSTPGLPSAGLLRLPPSCVERQNEKPRPTPPVPRCSHRPQVSGQTAASGRGSLPRRVQRAGESLDGGAGLKVVIRKGKTQRRCCQESLYGRSRATIVPPATEKAAHATWPVFQAIGAPRL